MNCNDVKQLVQDRYQKAHAFLASHSLDADRMAPQVAGKVMSAFVRAVKPPAGPGGERQGQQAGRAS